MATFIVSFEPNNPVLALNSGIPTIVLILSLERAGVSPRRCGRPQAKKMSTNTKPVDGLVLYITNHFTHPVLEAQLASPRYHLARTLIERGQKLMVFCPLGLHAGSPFSDFLSNLRPRRIMQGKTVYLFPPTIVSPASATTVVTLILATLFLLLYLALARVKVVSLYSTTILAGSVGAVICRVKKIPMVANYGDPDFAREKGLSRRAFKFCEDLVMSRNHTYSMIYVDEVIGRYIRRNFPVGRTIFLPNGGYERGFVPPSKDSEEVRVLRAKLGLDGCKVALYAGQLTATYRTEILVSAARLAAKTEPRVRFLIVGGGSTLPVLQRQVAAAGLSDFFKFVGPVPYTDLSPYIVLADVGLQLLGDMCMGTKVIQYMVHRRPVISMGGWYDQYGEFLKNGINCVLVPPDPVRLGEVIVRVLNDGRLRESLGEEAWKTVHPYTWDKHAEVTESELNAAVETRK